MAKFRAILGDLTGSIGGVTFQLGPAGATVHRRQRTPASNSTQSTRARYAFAYISRRWGDAIPGFRATYIGYAHALWTNGRISTNDRQHAYLHQNIPFAYALGGSNSGVPATRWLDPDLKWRYVATLQPGNATIKVHLTPHPLGGINTLWLTMSRWANPAAARPYRRRRYCSRSATNPSQDSVMALARTLRPAEHATIWLQIWHSNTGGYSQPQPQILTGL